MYAYVMDLDGIADGIDKGEHTLYHRLKKMPSKVFRALKGQPTDFKVSIKYEEGAALPPGITSREVASYEIGGLGNATEKYGSRNLTSPIKTTLHYSLSRSGTVSLDRAEAVVEFSEWIDVPIIVPNVTANATAAENATTTANTTSAGETAKDGDEKSPDSSEETVEGEEASADKEDGEEASKEDAGAKDAGKTEATPPATEKKLRKRTIRIPLKVKDVTTGPASALPKEKILEAITRLADLKAKDTQKRETAAAKNALEAYIYDTREKLDSLDNIGKVSTEGQRDALRGELTDAEDWLYEDGEHATAADFKKRLGGIKKTGDLIFFRLSELEARPAAVAEARKWARETTSILKLYPQTRPWINITQINEVQGKVDEMVKWLEDKEAQQAKKAPHDEPVLTSADVKKKLVTVQEKLAKLNRIPKPKPKPAPKAAPANNTANGTDSSDGKNATDGAEKGTGGKKADDEKIKTKTADDAKAAKDEL
eukprot:TRINITY_DN499_c1_g2_i1.p1 TRINITY_DN499_c1_g2~~TRINITY_DN499_c1_g2_i1.p1  ORF type:complete len:545 (-),score=158.42 TRINITY_DN499_c1_g2_i1:541-1992(-)